MARSGFNGTNHLWFDGSLGIEGGTGQLTMFVRLFGRPSTTFVLDSSSASDNYRRMLVSAGGVVTVAINGALGSAFQDADAPIPDTQAWHSAAVVFNHAASRWVFSNGGNQGSSTSNRTAATPNQLTIGVNRAGGGGNANPTAEVSIWSTALTAQQIADLHAGADPRTIEGASLVAYIPMCEGAAAGTDHSGNSNAFAEVGTLTDEPDVPGIDSACAAVGMSPGTITATPGDGEVTVAEGVAPSGGVEPYTRDLYRSTDGTKGALLQAAVTLPYLDEAVTNDVEYFYTLEVTDDDDPASTEDTPTVSATPTATPPALAAGTIEAVPGDAEVTINEVIAPSGGDPPYTRNLYRSTDGSRGTLLAGDISYPYVDQPLTNGTEYFYTLEVDDGTDTEDTPQVSATPSAPAPAGTIEGTITHEEDDTPEVGAIVVAVKQNADAGAVDAVQAITGAGGAYEITGLDAGLYDVYARTEGTYTTRVRIGVEVE